MTFRSYSHCVISARSRRSAHSRLCGHRLDAGEGMGRPDPGVRCALPDPHLMRVDCRLTLTSADAVRGCPPAARAIRRAASYPRLGALHRRPAQHPHCPQRCGRGRHLHGLHARGREILEELFAGFTAALEARGAERGDVLRDIRRQLSGRQLAQADIGLPGLLASRPFLEGHLRAMVRRLPGVGFLEDRSVAGGRSGTRRYKGMVKRAGSRHAEIEPLTGLRDGSPA